MRRRTALLVMAGAVGLTVATAATVVLLTRSAPSPLEVRFSVPWRDHPALEVEHELAVPIERALVGTPRLRGLRSVSRPGGVETTAVFDGSGKSDLFEARQAVLARLQGVSWPSDASPPGMAPAGRAALRYTVSSETIDLASLGEVAWRVVALRLLQVPGVAAVEPCGPQREVRVWLDPARLRATGRTLDEVVDAVGRSRGLPAGRIEGAGEQFLVRGLGPPSSLETLAALPVGRGGAGATVLLRDLARIDEGVTQSGCVARHRGRQVVGGTVWLQPVSDEASTLAELRARIGAMSLPPGARAQIFDDAPGTVGLRLIVAFPGGTRPEQATHASSKISSALGALPGVTDALELLSCDETGADSVELLLRVQRRDAPLAAAIERCLGAVPDVQWRTDGPLGDDESALVLHLIGPDREALGRLLVDARRRLSASPRLLRSFAVATDDTPTIEAVPDREALARFGLDAPLVARHVSAAQRGLPAGTFESATGRVPLTLWLGTPGDAGRRQLADLPVSRQGQPAVPLTAVAALRNTPMPRAIERRDGSRAVTLHLAVRGSARAFIEAAGRLLGPLPAGYRWSWVE